MLNETQAYEQISNALSGIVIKAWARYRNYFLFRVEHPLEDEKDWDPFFSVNIETGEIRDFSVLTDGDISEIAALKWTDI